MISSSIAAVRRGLARTFQLNTLLKGLTVLEDVQLAILEHRKEGGRALFGARAQERAAEAAYDLLERLRLGRLAAIPSWIEIKSIFR